MPPLVPKVTFTGVNITADDELDSSRDVVDKPDTNEMMFQYVRYLHEKERIPLENIASHEFVSTC